jgi:hypothetical protein
MITRRHFLSSCAVTAVTPCANAAAQVTTPFTITVTTAGQSPIIPANRTTLWRPGVTYNTVPGLGSPGIPTNRPQFGPTLTPLGGGQDDAPQINNAMANCPADHAVQLSAGVFTIKTAIYYHPSNVTFSGNGSQYNNGRITLRGVGPGKGLGLGQQGTFVADATATQLYCTIDSPSITMNGYTALNRGELSAFSLASDAIQGSYTCTLTSDAGLVSGQFVAVDQYGSGTTYGPGGPNWGSNDPDVMWGPNMDPPGGNSRQWFMIRPDRPLSQIFEVASYNSSTFTVTFTTPFHHTMCAGSGTSSTGVVAGQAQLVFVKNFGEAWMCGMGLEDMMFFDASTANHNGIISMAGCAYSWIKHVETQWNTGVAVVLSFCFRCELRDSFIHEAASPVDPGGAAYLTALSSASSDCLFENNIMWAGNKVNVMQTAGGGNVIAYNYMQDAYHISDLVGVEAGVNASHQVGTHMELIEGNYTQNLKGDSFWGAAIDITFFRNWATGLRAAHPPLNTLLSGTDHYLDLQSRHAVDVQAFTVRNNFIGNVLGFGAPNAVMVSGEPGGITGGGQMGLLTGQTSFSYENITTIANDAIVSMWQFGVYQQPAISQNLSWPNSIVGHLRQGNWDWVTKSQIWYANPIGASGATSTGTPQSIPNSLYLPAGNPPAFWGSNPWPWVDPSTGTTYTLPAKARFDAGTPNQV